jgi:hypothetical protein
MSDLKEVLDKDKETLRPYRLYDVSRSGTYKLIMGRWYRWIENAHDAAVVICRRDLKVGRTIEVVNIRNLKLEATYTKQIGGIRIKKAEELRAEERRAS